jgi:hypothetical protein
MTNRIGRGTPRPYANTTNYVDSNAPDGVLNYPVEAFNSTSVSSQVTFKTNLC